MTYKFRTVILLVLDPVNLNLDPQLGIEQDGRTGFGARYLISSGTYFSCMLREGLKIFYSPSYNLTTIKYRLPKCTNHDPKKMQRKAGAPRQRLIVRSRAAGHTGVDPDSTLEMKKQPRSGADRQEKLVSKN